MNKRISIFLLISLFTCFLFADKTEIDDLTNPNATVETKNLYLYLQSVYGNKILSGQSEIKYADWLGGLTGKDPVICGFDFTDHTANPELNVDDAIYWAKERNGIVTYHWHWKDPMTKTGNFYSYPEYRYPNHASDGTKFDAAKIFEPESPEYAAMIEDIDLIAQHLKSLQNKGIPVLWRPLHEATGNKWDIGWFWWSTGGAEKIVGGAKDINKSAAACKELWNVMHDRLVNYHKLNNLIWIWNTTGTEREEKWYPGDDKVDMIGADIYDIPVNSSSYQLFNQIKARHGNKMIAMTENGSIPDPVLLREENAHWLYFLTWGNFVRNKEQNSCSFLQRAFHDDYVITNPSSQETVFCNDERIPNPDGSIGAEEEGVERLGGVTIENLYECTGDGYAANFVFDDAEIVFTVNNPKSAGEYDMYLSYLIPEGWGKKGLHIYVNDVPLYANNNGSSKEYMLETDNETFTETPPISVYLKKGENKIALKKGWGYYCINYLSIPAVLSSSFIIKTEYGDRNIRNFRTENNHTVSFDVFDSDNITSMAVYSPTGCLLKEINTEFTVGRNKVSFNELDKGFYLIIFRSNSKTESYKLNIN